MASLYVHINKVNNKKYVGISSHSDPSVRWGKDGVNYKRSIFYDDGILVYGWECFDHIVLLSDIDIGTAQQLEARLIDLLNLTNSEYGYNESKGVNIVENPIFDILANNLIVKINSSTGEDLSLFEPNYQYRTTMYKLSMLLWIYNENKINTDLDCQRGYVWTEDRQQGLWDTLLFGHRIPEIHALRGPNASLDIMDGKQRVTTIMNILNNKIPIKKSYSSIKLQNTLFKTINKNNIYFSDLPQELQNRLLDTEIPVAEYWDMSDEDMTALFRKLNAGAALSEFSKGIANNINIRTRFTRSFTSPEHKTLQKFFSENDFSKNEDEKFLIRLMIMLKTSLDCDCTPREMEKHYKDFTTPELLNYQKIIADCLNRVEPYISLLDTFRSKKSYFPIICYIIITKSLTDEEIKIFFNKIVEQNYVGRGGDLTRNEINARYNKLMLLLKDIRSK